jgi:hypothetical protein
MNHIAGKRKLPAEKKKKSLRSAWAIKPKILGLDMQKAIIVFM